MTQRMNMFHNVIAVVAFMSATLALVPGCTSEPKQVSIPSTANPNDEVASVNEELKVDKQNQVDLLSPRNYEKAQEYAAKAQAAREKDQDNKEVLKDIGMAKAYLNLATEHADQVKSSTTDIMHARDEAIQANAAQLVPKKLSQADKKFKDIAYDAEKDRASIKADKRADLQRDYMNLQVESLKITHLGPVESAIESAKKARAKKYAPKTLAAAEAKLHAAQNVIETDRNNSVAIRQASNDARKEASKLLKVTSIAKNEKASENAALELYANRISNQKMDEELAQAETTLLEQREKTNEIRQENAQLERKNQFNESLSWAQDQFNSNEAEVYRQGDKLLIRLKNMNYKSGQSTLPSAAYPTLQKVKDVIAKIGADKVTIEGHTDSIGSEILNKKLSQERAEGVANYLSQGDVIGKNQIDVEGYGDAKPLSPNNTKAGRAQNRRVDVIITPTGDNTTSEVE
jgi:outer membrane protein OmpA-like peptidoglycan-associated protein